MVNTHYEVNDKKDYLKDNLTESQRATVERAVIDSDLSGAIARLGSEGLVELLKELNKDKQTK